MPWFIKIKAIMKYARLVCVEGKEFLNSFGMNTIEATHRKTAKICEKLNRFNSFTAISF